MSVLINQLYYAVDELEDEETITIRQLQLQDAPALIKLMKRDWYNSFVDFYNNDPNLTKQILDFEEVGEEMAANKAIFYGFFQNEELTGFAKMCIHPDRCLLKRIFVDELALPHNAGKLLLKASMEHSLSVGINTMGVQIEAKNEEALAFYEENGFIAHRIKTSCPFNTAHRYYYTNLFCPNVNFSLQQLSEAPDFSEELLFGY